ncbi:Os09g0284250, partial [Oryza sativa Japonica Group]
SSTSSSRTETEWARFFPSKSDLFSCVFLKLVEGKYFLYPPLSFPPTIGLYPEEINAESNSFSSLSLQLTLGFSGSNPLVWSPISLIQGYKKDPLVALFRLSHLPSSLVLRSAAATPSKPPPSPADAQPRRAVDSVVAAASPRRR